MSGDKGIALGVLVVLLLVVSAGAVDIERFSLSKCLGDDVVMMWAGLEPWPTAVKTGMAPAIEEFFNVDYLGIVLGGLEEKERQKIEEELCPVVEQLKTSFQEVNWHVDCDSIEDVCALGAGPGAEYIYGVYMTRIKPGRSGVVERAFKRVFETLAGAHENLLLREIEEEGGARINTLQIVPLNMLMPSLTPCFAVKNDVLILGTMETPVRFALSRLAGPRRGLVDEPEFQAAVRCLPERAHEITYVDAVTGLQVLRAMANRVFAAMQAASGAKPETVRAAEYATGTLFEFLGVVKSFSMAWTYSGNRAIGTAHVALNPKADPRLLRLYEAEMGESGVLKCLPYETSTFNILVGGSQLTDFYDYVLERMAGIPEYGKVWAAKWEELQTEYGINLREDLLSWIGSEVGMAQMNPRGGLQGMHEMLLTVKTKDPQRSRVFMTKLADLIERLTERRPSSYQFEGYEIFSIGLPPLLSMPSIGFAVVDDWFLVGLPGSEIETFIRTYKGDAPGMSANPDYKEIAAVFKPPYQAIAYANLEKQLRAVADMMQGLGMMANFFPRSSQMAPMRVIFRLYGATSPAFRKMSMVLKRQGSRTTVEDGMVKTVAILTLGKVAP